MSCKLKERDAIRSDLRMKVRPYFLVKISDASSAISDFSDFLSQADKK